MKTRKLTESALEDAWCNRQQEGTSIRDLARMFGVHPATMQRGLERFSHRKQLRESKLGNRIRELVASTIISRWIDSHDCPRDEATGRLIDDPIAQLGDEYCLKKLDQIVDLALDIAFYQAQWFIA